MNKGRHSPAGGLHSLMAMAGRLHILRMLLLIPLLGLLCARKVLAAVVLGLTLVADLAASWLSRSRGLVDDAGVALESIADMLVQGALILCLVPRFPALRAAGWLLLARLVLVLLPGWVAALRRGRISEAGPLEKAFIWLGCALLIAPILQPGMSPGAVQALATAELTPIAATILLGMIRVRNDYSEKNCPGA